MAHGSLHPSGSQRVVGACHLRRTPCFHGVCNHHDVFTPTYPAQFDCEMYLTKFAILELWSKSPNACVSAPIEVLLLLEVESILYQSFCLRCILTTSPPDRSARCACPPCASLPLQMTEYMRKRCGALRKPQRHQEPGRLQEGDKQSLLPSFAITTHPM